jgi:hypothetical protein
MRASSPQREGVAGIPQRRARLHAPLPRVAVGIPPCRVPTKNDSGEYPMVPSIASRLLAGRPGEPPQVFQSEVAAQGRSRAAPGAVPQPSVGSAPLGSLFLGLMWSAAPWIPPRSVPSFSEREPGSCSHRGWEFGIGASSGGRGHRGRASLYYERTRPPGTDSVLGHSGLHRCGCRTRTVRRSPRQRRRRQDSVRYGARPTQAVLNRLWAHRSHARRSRLRILHRWRFSRYSPSPIPPRSFKTNPQVFHCCRKT